MPSIVGQHIIQLRTPGIDLRTRLGGTVIAELRANEGWSYPVKFVTNGALAGLRGYACQALRNVSTLPRRRPIPDHIPRQHIELTTGDDACADCGGKLRRLGEDVTEELEYVPGRFIVNRITRPRFACSGCDSFTQAQLPSRPIERGRPGPGLLAHVLVSKYADHLPLYRQSRIFERDGLDLDRSTLADWVGKSTALVEPLAVAIGRHVQAGQALFADDTPVKMLTPGAGKTQTARLWTYVRDERPWDSEAPPAAWYQFSPDRRGQHPKDHLKRYQGWMHADGYSGFNDLYRSVHATGEYSISDLAELFTVSRPTVYRTLNRLQTA